MNDMNAIRQNCSSSMCNWDNRVLGVRVAAVTGPLVFKTSAANSDNSTVIS
jgi:hypothetical protein